MCLWLEGGVCYQGNAEKCLSLLPLLFFAVIAFNGMNALQIQNKGILSVKRNNLASFMFMPSNSALSKGSRHLIMATESLLTVPAFRESQGQRQVWQSSNCFMAWLSDSTLCSTVRKCLLAPCPNNSFTCGKSKF